MLLSIFKKIIKACVLTVVSMVLPNVDEMDPTEITFFMTQYLKSIMTNLSDEDEEDLLMWDDDL